MNPTVVVTGANRGIGLELCRCYADAGAKVFAVCRNASTELQALAVEIVDGVDVADAAAVTSLHDRLRQQKIDVLINNAGILRVESVDAMDFDNVRLQFEVNALAPLRVVHALLGLMNKNSKIALVTSRMGSMADNGSGGYYGYRMSKAALNAAGVSLARDLRQRGIAVAILHPGFVQTGMVNFAGDISAAEAAGRLKKRIDELNLNNSGMFRHSNGEALPW